MSYYQTLAVRHNCNQLRSRAPLTCWAISAAAMALRSPIKSHELYLRAGQRKASAGLCGAEAHCVATTHTYVCAQQAHMEEAREAVPSCAQAPSDGGKAHMVVPTHQLCGMVSTAEATFAYYAPQLSCAMAQLVQIQSCLPLNPTPAS
jgi:hypothetical protein